MSLTNPASPGRASGRIRAAGALAVLAATALSGCVVAPPRQVVVEQQGAVVVAPTAPPAPYVETVTVAPSLGAGPGQLAHAAGTLGDALIRRP
jgi:hypothetical protein